MTYRRRRSGLLSRRGSGRGCEREWWNISATLAPWGNFELPSVSVRRSTWLTDADGFGIEVRASVFSRWPYDSGHALYLALGIEEDSETGPYRSQIGKRHAPRVAVHLLFESLGQFFSGSELLGFVFSH